MIYLYCVNNYIPKKQHNNKSHINIINNKSYINNIDEKIILSQLKIILNDIKIVLNKNNKLIKFNIANQPIITTNKNFNDIIYFYNNIINLLNLRISNIKICDVINIIEIKTENQAKISFQIIIEYKLLKNIILNIEIIYEKLYCDEDIFHNKKPITNTFISKLDIN